MANTTTLMAAVSTTTREVVASMLIGRSASTPETRNDSAVAVRTIPSPFVAVS
jgi:hypothetical protein